MRCVGLNSTSILSASLGIADRKKSTGYESDVANLAVSEVNEALKVKIKIQSFRSLLTQHYTFTRTRFNRLIYL